MLQYSQKNQLKMVRRKIKQVDENYERPQPRTYRRYARKTKLKFCWMVKVLKMQQSKAAKLLKIKDSTAKMILKNFQIMSWHPIFQKQFEKEFGNLKKKAKKETKLEQEMNKIQIPEPNFQAYNYIVPYGYYICPIAIVYY